MILSRRVIYMMFMVDIVILIGVGKIQEAHSVRAKVLADITI